MTDIDNMYMAMSQLQPHFYQGTLKGLVTNYRVGGGLVTDYRVGGGLVTAYRVGGGTSHRL